jgi:uncharacterized Zn finger protein
MTMPIGTTIDHFKNIPCRKCGCIYWMNTFKMKLIPGVITKTGKDDIKPRPTAVCANCGSFWEQTADMKNPVSEDRDNPAFPNRPGKKDA